MARATTRFTVHETPEDIFAPLARLFPLQERDGSRWLDVPSDGIVLTFFGVRVDPDTDTPDHPDDA